MSNIQYPLNRFDKPSKELLVGMINKYNGVRLDPKQLVFGKPTLLDGSGLTEVSIQFHESMGWSREQKPLTYHRIEANRMPDLRTLVIHQESYDGQDALLKAVFDQCGVLLEPELLDIQEVFGYVDEDQSQLAVVVVTTDLTGFTPTAEEELVIDPNGDRSFKLTFKEDHLVYFGYLHVVVRPALKLLNTTIARRMDFRQYYIDGNLHRPPVDLYVPHGRLLVGDTWPDRNEAKVVEAYLYELKPVQLSVLNGRLAEFLCEMTGDPWTYVADTPSAFNIYNSTISYNGLVSDVNSVGDPRYSYVLIIQLGSLCENLSGVLRIGYRYSSSQVPTNQQYNPASANPIFTF